MEYYRRSRKIRTMNENIGKNIQSRRRHMFKLVKTNGDLTRLLEQKIVTKPKHILSASPNQIQVYQNSIFNQINLGLGYQF